MIIQAIQKINETVKGYKKHGNEWNIANQLIDILTACPESAEIVLQDLKNKDMSVTAMVDKIKRKRIADPAEVMKAICDFYKIAVPDALPPEHWRTPTEPVKRKSVADISLLDLM